MTKEYKDCPRCEEIRAAIAAVAWVNRADRTMRKEDYYPVFDRDGVKFVGWIRRDAPFDRRRSKAMDT